MQALLSPLCPRRSLLCRNTRPEQRGTRCTLCDLACLPAADGLALLGSSLRGLPFDEVLRRLVQEGPNYLAPRDTVPAALRDLARCAQDGHCTVRRQLRLYGLPDSDQQVPVHQLVRGDILCLFPGDWLSADVRLLGSDGLVLERSIQQPWAQIGVMGDRVVAGTALALVIATGQATHLGQLFCQSLERHTAKRTSPRSEFQAQERFPFTMSRLSRGACQCATWSGFCGC